MEMKRKSGVSRAGIILLIVSFVLQVIFLILSYSNFFTSVFKASSSSLSWLSSFTDTMAYAAYISIGSCATQFFLIRLFSIQSSGEGNAKNPYLLFCLAAVVYDNWYLIDALRKGLAFGVTDIAHLLFGLVLMVLILIAIMINSHILGSVCAIGAILMTLYNIWVIVKLIGLVSTPVVIGILLCEVLYGIGLSLCLFGIRKPEVKNEQQ